MNKKTLILVDFENEWIDKNSDYYVGNISGVIVKTNRLLDYCRKNDYKIIFTRHVEEDSGGAFATNSTNVEIIKDIHREKSDPIITKNKISPFYQTDLEKKLAGIREIVVSGILTNLCVRSLVSDAYDRNFKITVVKDCCVTMNPETQAFTFRDLKETREEIEFFNVKDFIK